MDKRILSFSSVTTTLEITPALDPPNRCAYVDIAADKGGTSIPNSPANRLIWYVEKNVTYYSVKWHPNDTNGGTWSTGGNDPIGYSVADGTRVDATEHLLPQLVAPTGYTFGGWYINNTTPLADQLVNSNTDVYAHWVPETPSSYTVTWNPNSGTWPDTTTTNRQRTVNTGTLISSLSQDTPSYLSGWQFDKWTYSDGTDIPAGATVDSDITLLAHYTQISYSVSLEMDNFTAYTLDTTNYPSGTHTGYHWHDLINIPTPEPTKASTTTKQYSFSGWALKTGPNTFDITRRLGMEIPVIEGNYTFVATFNQDDKSNGNIKVFDNLGQHANFSKNSDGKHPHSVTLQDTGSFWTESNNGWYSLVYDGHSDDVYGNGDVLLGDGGISPSEAIRKSVLQNASRTYGERNTPSDGDRTWWGYVGDSIIYEQFNLDYAYEADHLISGFKTSGSLVTSNDLLTEITFKNSNNEPVLHIKSENPDWIKFAIIDLRTGGQPITTDVVFTDDQNYNPNTYTDNDAYHTTNIPVYAEIQYYIKDNTGSGAVARHGKVKVESPKGGDCSYVIGNTYKNTLYYSEHPTSIPFQFDSTNNKYMTIGYVHFYQLGPNYSNS